MLSFITPTQGNPIALKRTIDSLKEICDDFIVGSVCVFKQDEEKINSYANEINLNMQRLPFNCIYWEGFSWTLNHLASFAKNPIVLYLNVGEVIEKSDGCILDKIRQEYNCYYIDHSTEKHRWFRAFNPSEMKWSGFIHEEIVGEHRPYHKPLFTFADTEKDMSDPFKAAVYNDIKEMCYWKQLMRIVDEPETLGATSEGWIQFAKDNYQTMKDRLNNKGSRWHAFSSGDLDWYLNEAYNSQEFEKERFVSNHIIEFQGDPKYLNK